MSHTIERRKLIGCIATGAALALTGRHGLAQTPTSVRIGYAISKTGPNAGGANITTLPNYQLWVKEVNAAGGLKLGDKRLPIELVEYDDRSNSEEAVRAVERLATQDRVDFILPPWGTGLNLAVGPILNRTGYPHLAVTAVTDRAPELAKRWPNSFWLLGTSLEGATSLVDLLTQMRKDGKIGDAIAMVAVSDQFGIELSSAARPAFLRAGFKLVYDRSYPLGTQDMQPIVSDAARANPDAFVAWSYPPDTIALTEAARLASFNPKLFYTAVGTAFPLYKQRFAANTEGVMGIGGWNPDAPAQRDYFERHKAAIGREPDRWASPVTFASLQMLQQAIERVGRVDRAAVIDAISKGSFETILGTVKLQDNLRRDLWWVGQWQGGEFYGLAPKQAGVRQPLFPKPAWKAT